MKIVGVSSFNSVNLSQNSKKTADNQNFGKILLADDQACDVLIEKIIDHGNLKYVTRLVDLITLCKGSKDIVYISSKAPAKVYNPTGIQICPTNDSNEFSALYMALKNVVNEQPKKEEAPKPKEETIGEVVQRLAYVLRNCPVVENIEQFFKPASKVGDASRAAA